MHQVKLEKGDGRMALCIVKNNLLISERGFDGAIVVYDRELNYVRCRANDFPFSPETEAEFGV